ncbi:MAG TPA: phosphoribosyl-AMP cyclohydrolase [Bacteroidales bacterium]|nr:phosphoribosyl-AMP cyclohydrolase [Bacteroidales bacterium]
MEEKEYTSKLMLDFGTDGNRLVPVVTQDFSTREVLILAFCNKEAFEESIISGYATYYSRSRNALWKKGLTSGNMLKLNEIRINCEQDSLLYLVTPEGRGSCHAKKPDGDPYGSCFYRRLSPGGDKLEIIAQDLKVDEKG